MMQTVICYKLDTPVVYNAGTPYERQHDTFLEGYTHLSKEEAQVLCDKANRGEITHIHHWPVEPGRTYFAHEQEPFDTTGT